MTLGDSSNHRLLQRAVEAGLVRESASGDVWIGAGPETVQWGVLSGLLEPVARVRPGQRVRIDTLSHEGLMPDQDEPRRFFGRFGIPSDSVLAEAIEIYARVQHSALGPHIITGPIAIEGAEPGDVLAVHVIEVRLRVPYGVNSIRMNKGVLHDEFTLNRSILVPFDMARRVGLFEERIEIPLAPFFGIMATAPARSLGRQHSGPPGAFGGNLDIKHFTAGSVIYLPVHVKDALFSVGDGHAAQGNGEVNVTAIETSLTGVFQFDLVKGAPISLPRGETPTHWIVMGLHENLDEAMKIAVRETIRFLVELRALSRADAYSLASMAVDYEVSQVVNGVKGVHAMIPKAMFLTGR